MLSNSKEAAISNMSSAIFWKFGELQLMGGGLFSGDIYITELTFPAIVAGALLCFFSLSDETLAFLLGLCGLKKIV